MSSLLNITSILVPAFCVQRALRHFRRVGKKGFEGVALWAGRRHSCTFEVREAIVPEQTAVQKKEGLFYVVEEGELHRINVFLHENNLTLVAQLHSHPSEAFHSQADDAFPIITTLGGFSIVVPDFGRGSVCMSKWAVYRLLTEQGWTQLDAGMASRLIELKD